VRDAVSFGNAESVAFAEWLVWMGLRWLTYRDVLVGVAWAFMEVHEMVARLTTEKALLSSQGMSVLKDIAARERAGLEVCRKEIEGDETRNAEFLRGVGIGRQAIEACFNS
jgi:hypothetical protein